MGNSLLEQLKKTGLVDKTQAQKLKHSQYKNKKKKSKKGSDEPMDEARQQAQQALTEKAERDRLLNQQRQEEANRKAIAAQIKQLIESNRVEDRDGDIVYNFTDTNVVKRLYVSAQIHQHLISGHLAIARLEDAYELVPVPVAEKIRQRDAQCVILLERQEGSPSSDDAGDDPYADYKIPDDLMW